MSEKDKKIQKIIDICLQIFMWIIAVFYFIISIKHEDIGSILLSIFLIIFDIRTSLILKKENF